MTAARDVLAQQLAQTIQAWTGFRREAVEQRTLAALLERELAGGKPPETLARELAGRDPELLRTLASAVSVGETYFFRHPEHFQLLEQDVLPARVRGGAAVYRAWSAGCATGEETYSLAACLRAAFSAAPGTRVAVLGTDLVDDNVVAARRGVYRPWSRREAGPLLHPLFQDSAASGMTIRDELRALVSFQVHNLLDPPPLGPGSFDLVLCRNVLIYFSPEARQAALQQLSSALAPGGVLLVGAVDVDHEPPGLQPLHPGSLQAFHKPAAVPVRPPTVPPSVPARPAAAPPAGPAPATPSWDAAVLAHLPALDMEEQGRERLAQGTLEDLLQRFPGYVPAMLHLALILQRRGDRARATSWMIRVLQQTEGWPVDRVVQGPEALPVSYYRTAATAFLARREVRP